MAGIVFTESSLRSTGFVDPRTVLSQTVLQGPVENVATELRRLGYRSQFTIDYENLVKAETGVLNDAQLPNGPTRWTVVWFGLEVLLAFVDHETAVYLKLML